MPEFVIERNMPGVGALGPGDLKSASQTSCLVLNELGPAIQWVQSYGHRRQDLLYLSRADRRSAARARAEGRLPGQRHL